MAVTEEGARISDGVDLEEYYMTGRIVGVLL
jgi:hypothetical protein